MYRIAGNFRGTKFRGSAWEISWVKFLWLLLACLHVLGRITDHSIDIGLISPTSNNKSFSSSAKAMAVSTIQDRPLSNDQPMHPVYLNLCNSSSWRRWKKWSLCCEWFHRGVYNERFYSSQRRCPEWNFECPAVANKKIDRENNADEWYIT